MISNSTQRTLPLPCPVLCCCNNPLPSSRSRAFHGPGGQPHQDIQVELLPPSSLQPPNLTPQHFPLTWVCRVPSSMASSRSCPPHAFNAPPYTGKCKGPSSRGFLSTHSPPRSAPTPLGQPLSLVKSKSSAVCPCLRSLQDQRTTQPVLMGRPGLFQRPEPNTMDSVAYKYTVCA